MADNSIRERIILDVISTLESIDTIAKVARKKLEFDQLDSVALTQMPYVAVVAHLPKPDPKFSKRNQHTIDKFISDLDIALTIYGQDVENPDSMVSSLLDDIWKKMYVDPTRDGLAMRTLLVPDSEVGILDPYFAFNIACTVTYIHDTQSI